MNLREKALSLLVGLFLVLPQILQAESQTPFYQKKTIQVVIGSALGGHYDRWGRLFAQQHWKVHPRQSQSRPSEYASGGSMVATNYLYGLAKPDGLTVGMF